MARVAGAHGFTQAETAHELARAVRVVAAGRTWFRPIAPSVLGRLARRLHPGDRPVLSMLVYGTPPADIATVLGVSEQWLAARRWAILDQLRRPAATSAQPVKT